MPVLETLDRPTQRVVPPPSTLFRRSPRARLIASCGAAGCGYEEEVGGFAGHYCPYCGQDLR